MMDKYLFSIFLCSLISSIPALQAQEADIEEYFSIERIFELEQKEESFLASPIYSIDDDGEVLAADVRLNEVKIFDNNGLFVNSFGREGRGPGDFTNLISAVRMDDGNILTADVSGRLTLFSDNGEEVIETYNTPVIPLMGIEVIDTEKVLIFGRGSTSDSTHLIHLLDLSTKEIVEEFLELNFSEHPQILRILTNISSASVENNRVISAITPFKSLYIFNAEDYTLEEQVSFELNNFKQISEVDLDGGNPSLSDFTKFSWIDRIEVVEGDKILIQYVRWLTMPPPGSDQWRETEYSLALIDMEGEVIFDIQNSPKLIDFNREKEKFYFIDVLREMEEYDVSNIKTAKLK